MPLLGGIKYGFIRTVSHSGNDVKMSARKSAQAEQKYFHRDSDGYGSMTYAEISEEQLRNSAEERDLQYSKEKQIILDLTPEFRELIENSRLLAVERTLHNDNNKTPLLCCRLNNAFIRDRRILIQMVIVKLSKYRTL